MRYLRFLVIVISVLLLAYQGYSYFSIDEAMLQKTAGGGVAARFIQADEKTLEDIHKRLADLKEVPPDIIADPNKKLFGRKGLFYPDPE